MLRIRHSLTIISTILISLAFSSDVRNRDSPDWKQRNFAAATNDDGKTKVIVLVKSGVSLILDGRIKKTVEVVVEDTIVMGLEFSDVSMIEPLYGNSNIISIEPDYPVQIIDPLVNNNNTSDNIPRSRKLEDYIPYGVDMVLQKRGKFQRMKAKGSVKLCIADTGYDRNHDDLPKSPHVTGKDRFGESWGFDGNGHGTHVAGTVSALAGNGGGVVGVVPSNYKGKFKLLIAKAFDRTGAGSNSGVIDAINDCVSLGANIISMSLGCDNCYSYAMNAFLDDLYKNNDILLIAAAGNAGNSGYYYPASYNSVISVASITSNRVRSSFSVYNDQIELSAPGSYIWSTVPGNEYGIKDGTSMATPYVSGVAALLRMAFPKCKNDEIRKVLAFTAQDLDANGCDVRTGFGLIQALDAHKLLKKSNCGSLDGNPTGGCYKLTKRSGAKPKKKKKRNK